MYVFLTKNEVMSTAKQHVQRTHVPFSCGIFIVFFFFFFLVHASSIRDATLYK